MRPKEYVSGSRTVRFGAPGVAELWPQRLIFRGGSWNSLAGCGVVLLSPLAGLFLVVVATLLPIFEKSKDLPRDAASPPDVRALVVLAVLVGGPSLIALVWWVREVLAEGRRGPFEVIVEPAAIPGIIGETFKARIDVRMPDEPTSFWVRLTRTSARKGELAWEKTLRPSVSSVGRPAHDRYVFTIEIPVPQLEKKPGRDWTLAFEARCRRWATAYNATFYVRMNDDEADDDETKLPLLGLPANARDPM